MACVPFPLFLGEGAWMAAGQGMLNVVLLIVVVVGGGIWAYPCAFKRGVFREVFYLVHVLSKKVCSERCVQRGEFREP